jgi:hypothetical protein
MDRLRDMCFSSCLLFVRPLACVKFLCLSGRMPVLLESETLLEAWGWNGNKGTL